VYPALDGDVLRVIVRFVVTVEVSDAPDPVTTVLVPH
jgi:hypothetical protein